MTAGSSLQIVFLGTGTPRVNPDRCPPAAAVIAGGQAFLVDAGAGVIHRASQACRVGVEELEVKSIRHVFLTHLHSDHTLGLPDIIFSPWAVGRKGPVQIFGPEGTQDMVSSLLAAYKIDIRARTLGLEHNMSADELTSVQEISEGFRLEAAGVVIKAFQTSHGEHLPSLAYRFEAPHRIVTFSGDTRPCPGLEKAAENADVLVHEVYSADEAVPENRPGGDTWPQYLSESHTSSRELAELAKRLNPSVLILNHVLRSKTSDEELIAEVRQAGYAGKIAVAKDLEVF